MISEGGSGDGGGGGGGLEPRGEGGGGCRGGLDVTTITFY